MVLQANGSGDEVEKVENEKETTENGNKKQLGGIKTMPFILATEMCDRFAYVGFHVNLMSYLSGKMNLPLVKASNIISNLDGTASFTPLIGALIADSFAGRFWTIAVASVFYELGLVSLTVTALLKSLHPPSCQTMVNCEEASGSQLGILYVSLLLISVGLGGTRPCVVTFAADQYDMSKAGVASRGWNFFNWYYFFLGFSKLAALTVVVYIQDNVGWGWGLGIPTIALALAFIAFVGGSPLYKRVPPGGSPLVRLAQVVVAAFKKRSEVAPSDPNLLYQNKKLDANLSINGRLLHTNQFKWIDKAAIVKDTDETEPDQQPNLWRIATVHRIEELKSFIRILPVWAAAILYVTANSHQNSFVIQQARTMNRHMSPTFQFPPASLSIFTNSTVVVGVVLYERYFVPFMRRFTGNPSGITPLQRMGIGFSINILSTLVAALVEIRRKSVAASHGLLDEPTQVIPISVFWLVPQYCLGGAAELFFQIGQTEFLYDQSPESMRSIGMALFYLCTSVGSYLGTALVLLVHKYTGKNNWLPDRNLNRGKLDYYYWLIAIIQLVNLLYYVTVAWLYTSKPIEEANNDGDHVDADHEQSATGANNHRTGKGDLEQTRNQNV